MKKDGLAERDATERDRQWTRIDSYIGALARRRTERRRREGSSRGRTQPERPHAWLGTLPFLALSLAMALLAAALFIAAWPGRETAPKTVETAQREPGTAPPGWFDEARREFR